jgi:A/G-specific adenine glycosylase
MNNQESNKNLQHIVKPLLAWYKENARELPWRKSKDPYRVWVSEIMLQQTRVDTVIPYYERFLNELPTIRSLAEAPEEKLLKLWEGLGYYSRVRNMQKAAVRICREYNGSFPEKFEDILSLPGIGAYTAGAVSSIAFEQPTPAVDGNVLRVITRLTGNETDIGEPRLKEQIIADLAAVYPAEHCGDFTQCLMELGALICLPNQMPKCEVCPLKKGCYANQHQMQLQLPVKAGKEARKKENKTVLLIACGDKIAIQKRKTGGLLGGLWEFPNIDGKAGEQDIAEWLTERGLSVKNITKAVEKKHIFTHIEWDMTCFTVGCDNMNGEFTWVTTEILKEKISLPTAFRKFLPLINESLF